MRGTVAKRLRAAARRATVGQPERVYLIKTVKAIRFNHQIEHRFLVLGKCTRKVYKDLKRLYNPGNRFTRALGT